MTAVMLEAAGRGLLLATAMALGGTVAAHEIRHGDLAIAHPFVTIDKACNSKTTRAYVMLVANSGTKPDRLTGANLDRAGKGAFFRVTHEEGMVKRSPVAAGFEIVPGGHVALMPPDHVIEFPKTGQALIDGGMVTGSLTFERGGVVPVQFMVQAAHRAVEGKSDCSDGAEPPHTH